MKNRNIDKIVSKVLKETLESKIEGIESDIKNLTELGGMPSDVYDDEHPFKNVNFGKMTNREIEQLMSKHMGNEDEEEIEDEEYDEDNVSSMYGDDYDEDEEEELEEMFDSESIRDYVGKDYKFKQKDFEKIPLGKGKIGIDQDMLDRNTGVTFEKDFTDEFLNQMDLRDLLGDDGITGSDEDDDLEPMTEGAQVCNECGSNSLMEGECSECGYKMESEMEEGIYNKHDLNKKNEFDYVQEDLDFDEYDTDPREPNEERCKATLEIMRQGDCDYCEELLQRDNCNAITESLTKRQKRTLDKNKNNKIDAEDFKLLRKGKKKETKEGKKFPDLSGDGKVSKKDILMGRGVKFGKKKTKLKESIQLSEEEMIDLIENIIKEQKEKSKLRSIGKPRGLETYEKAHKGSGKENEDYIKSVAKKMKDYLKDGSKGEYTESPKHFPKGNGQLEKMKVKKYTMSKDGGDFIDDFTRPGMENLDYDEIHPDENWMKDTIEGSSRTGNNPKWANAEETELGEKINKKRKENKLAKAKRMAYNKSVQPVISDKTGEEDGKGINIKLESENVKQLKMLNEEFSKISNLISYNRKTQ
jgi:hypothetical protein